MSEPVRHTPTPGLFPSHSQNIAEILTTGMLSRDIPIVGLCLLKPEKAPGFHRSQNTSLLTESIPKHKKPHLASKTK